MSEVSSPYPNGTPAWVDLMTSDREAATRFYRGLFGWEFNVGGPETGFYSQGLVRGLPVAGIGEAPPPEAGGQQFPTAWTTYIAVDDCDAACERARAAGGQVVMEPMDVMEEGRMAMLTDPTGAIVGLWQAGRHLGARVVNEPNTLSWNELTTRDPAQATEFLKQVFGYELQQLPAPPDTPEFNYTVLKLNGRGVGGVLGMGSDWPGDVQPQWMTYFTVADADDQAAIVKELGGEVTNGPFDSPFGRIAVIRDPQGAVFSIIQTPEEADEQTG
jgi:hypothetical protein